MIDISSVLNQHPLNKIILPVLSPSNCVTSYIYILSTLLSGDALSETLLRPPWPAAFVCGSSITTAEVQ